MKPRPPRPSRVVERDELDDAVLDDTPEEPVDPGESTIGGTADVDF